MSHDVFNADQVSSSLAEVITCLNSVKADTCRVFLRETGGKCHVQTRLQALFGLRFRDPVEQQLYEVVLKNAIEAEKVAPHGFDGCIQRFLDRFNGMPSRSSKCEPEGIQAVGSSACRRSDIDQWIISGLSTVTTKLAEMVNEAIVLGGFGGSVIVEPTHALDPSLELVNGYMFELEPAFEVAGKFDDPRCLCVDGYVENVSEVHHLLTSASESLECVIVFLRGLSDDVKHTLKVNYDRRTLNVIPVVVDFDLHGLNTLNDLATIAGGDLVSSNKGDLISSIRLHETTKIDRVVIKDGRLIIRNARTKDRVQLHVSELRQRRSKSNVIDVSNLLDRRIRTLSACHVILRIPNDREYVMVSQAIDHALRTLRSIVEYGFIDIDGERVPALLSVAARFYSTRCVDTLKSIGGFVSP